MYHDLRPYFLLPVNGGRDGEGVDSLDFFERFGYVC